MNNNMKFKLNQKIVVVINGKSENCVIVRTIYETSCVPSEKSKSRSYWVKLDNDKIYEITENRLMYIQKNRQKACQK